MQAIHTKYLPTTNTKGAMLVAKCCAGKFIIAWDYSLGVMENHRQAAQGLINVLGWGDWESAELISGFLPDGEYAHILRKID